MRCIVGAIRNPYIRLVVNYSSEWAKMKKSVVCVGIPKVAFNRIMQTLIDISA